LEIKIVKGTAEHADACLSIAKELMQYFNEKAIEILTEDLHQYSFYVAISVDNVVGFVTIETKNKNVAEISWMAVRYGWQHQGIGASLINYIVNDLKPHGIKLLTVKTLSNDADYPPYEATRQFYEKMGFIHIETINPYPGWEPGNPCAIYIKIL